MFDIEVEMLKHSIGNKSQKRRIGSIQRIEVLIFHDKMHF